MRTDAQLQANRQNAQLSTGPKTEAGKVRSASNHFRHGLTGVFRLLPDEDRGAYSKLVDDLFFEHKPSTATEKVLVERMAQHIWLTNRAIDLQTICDIYDLPLYLRYQTTHDRAFHKCLADLLKLRAEKRKAELGFESQKRRQAEETRKQAREARAQAEEIRRQAAEKRKVELHFWKALTVQAGAEELYLGQADSDPGSSDRRLNKVLEMEAAALAVRTAA